MNTSLSITSGRAWRHSSKPRAAALALSIGCFACEDPLVDPQTVVDLRVLAGQISAEDDERRATLEPGERANVHWLVASDEAQDFAATLAWCRIEPTTLGAPVCAEAPFDEQQLEGNAYTELSAEFTLPDDLQTGDEWAAWLGVCERTTPEFDPRSSSFDCGSERPLSAYLRAAVGADDNHNPDLSDDLLEIDGEPWSAAPLADTGSECAELDLPQVELGDPAKIRFELDGDDRQPIDADEDAYNAQPAETLVVSHMATLPGLERVFSAIEHDADNAEFELEFELDEDSDLPRDGRVVTVTLIARDERGGVGWINRQLCALP